MDRVEGQFQSFDDLKRSPELVEFLDGKGLEPVERRFEQKLDVIFAAGIQGSGKGTQSTKIVEKYGYEHISAGDVLRAKAENDEGLRNMMQSGALVPVEVVFGALMEKIENSPSRKFIIDGFPRTIEQVKLFEDFVKDNNCCVIDINISENMARERMSSRNRKDDTPEAIDNRINTYKLETVPAISSLKSMVGYVVTLDGEESKENVFDEISNHVEKFEKGNKRSILIDNSLRKGRLTLANKLKGHFQGRV